MMMERLIIFIAGEPDILNGIIKVLNNLEDWLV